MKTQAYAHESADSMLTKEGFDSLQEMLEGLAGRSLFFLLLLLGFLRLCQLLLHLRKLRLQVLIGLPGLLRQLVPLRQVLAKLSIFSLDLHELGRKVRNLPRGGEDWLQDNQMKSRSNTRLSFEPTLDYMQSSIGSGATWERNQHLKQIEGELKANS